MVDDGTSLLDAADGPAPLSVEVWLSSRAEAATTAAEKWDFNMGPDATPQRSDDTAATTTPAPAARASAAAAAGLFLAGAAPAAGTAGAAPAAVTDGAAFSTDAAAAAAS